MRHNLLRSLWLTAVAAMMVLMLAGGASAQVLISPGWNGNAAIPGDPTSSGSCVESGGYIYCVGGNDTNASYFAPLTVGGIGAWQQTTSYGEGGYMNYLTCVASGGYIYCIAGQNVGGQSNAPTSDVWFAPLSSSGIGAWQETISYGLPQGASAYPPPPVAGLDVFSHACVTANGFVYCIGGKSTTVSTDIGEGGESVSYNYTNTNEVLYSHVSNRGDDGWFTLNPYPDEITAEGCVTANGYIYCVGGDKNFTNITDGDTSDAFYTQIMSDGTLGSWQATTAYGGGATSGLSCAVTGPNITCVGGHSAQVWTAPLGASGIGAWTRGIDYPESVTGAACAATGGEITCVGGGSHFDFAALGYVAGDNAVNSAFYPGSIDIADAGTCAAVLGTWQGQTCTTSAQIETLNGGSLTVDTQAVLDLTSSASFADSGNFFVKGLLENYGFVSVAGTATITGAVANFGTFQSLTPTTTINTGSFRNDGTLTVSPAAFINNGAVYNQCAGKINGTISGAAVQSLCNPSTSTVTLSASSFNNGAQITVTDTITDVVSNGGSEPLDALPAFNDQNGGGSFSAVSCQGSGPAMVCSALYTAPMWGTQGVIVADYQDTYHTKSEGSAGYTLTGIPTTTTLTSSANPSAAGQPLTFTAVVTSAAGAVSGGQVSFSDNGTFLSAIAPSNGVAALTLQVFPTLSAGTHQITASFGGTFNNAKYLPSSTTLTQQVDALTVVQDAGSCGAVGGAWIAGENTCTMAVGNVIPANSFLIASGVELWIPGGGHVTVAAGGSVINDGTIADQGAVTVAAGGSLANNGALNINCGGSLSGTVVGSAAATACDPTTVALTPQLRSETVGTSFQLTATATDTAHAADTPIGRIDWTLNGAGLGSCRTTSGACTFAFNADPSVGPMTLTATLDTSTNLDPGHLPSSAQITINAVEPTTTTLASAAASSPYGVPLALTSSTPVAANGGVSFFDGVTPIGGAPVTANGQAAFAAAQLLPGAHQLRAVFQGTPALGSSASTAVAATVVPNPQNFFKTPSLAMMSDFPQDVAVGDFNHDGKLDLAFTVAGGVSIWLGQGNGQFVQGATYPLPYAGTLVAADFNDDGNLDLAVAVNNVGTGGIAILMGHGDGTFDAPRMVYTGTAVTSLAIGDFNGDGTVDLAATLVSPNAGVGVLLGNGDGTFGAPLLLSISENLGAALTVGDLNGDGIADLVVTDGSSNITVELGNGDGTFRSAGTVALANGLDINLMQLSQPVLADFNGDDKLDLAVSNGTQNGVLVALGNGDGTFQPPVFYPAGPRPAAIVAGDFNADGKIDLAVTSLGNFQTGTAALYLLPGVGDGTFAPATALSLPDLPLRMVAGNFDGDGLVSLAITGGDNTLMIAGGLAPTPQTISFAPLNDETWPGTPVQLAAGASSGLAVTLISITPSICTVSGSTATVLSGGVCSITASQPGDQQFAAAPPVTESFTIHSAATTLQWSPPVAIVYGTGLGNTQLDATVSGGVTGTISYSPAAGAVLNAGSETLSATFTPSNTADYLPATTTVTLQVTPAAPGLHLIGGAFPYTGQPHAASVVATGLGGATVAGSVTLAYTPGGTAAPVNAGSYAVTANFASSDPNYASATASATLTIAPAPLTITANSAARRLRQPNPVFTASFSGFVGSDSPASLAGTLSLTTTATRRSPEGVYPIALSGVNDPNYAIAFVPGTLTVYGAPAAMTIIAGNQQQAGPNAALAPLVVRVTDAAGNAVPDARVSFRSQRRDGEFTDGRGRVEVVSNASGLATASTFTTGDRGGAFTIEVRSAAVAATFDETNTAAAPASPMRK